MTAEVLQRVLTATGYIADGTPANGVLLDSDARSSRRGRNFVPDALWSGQSSLTVYFKAVDEPPLDEEIAAWRREIWNEGFAPLLWVVSPNRIDLYNGFGDYDRANFTVEDAAVAQIKFDNGSVVTLESSFMLNGPDVWETQLYGTKAGAVLKPFGQNDGVQIYTEQNKQLLNASPANVPHVDSSHVEEVKAFVRAIANGSPSPVPGENGLILNAIFDAIYKSSETGNEEKVDVSF
ncbi:MAG: hypothetical protein EOO77_43480 [Oxalobacteraceae bacterium]|nr:MAG: hypothetical protein EOO77_43480 [Oxalobacteraceae bacterium]